MENQYRPMKRTFRDLSGQRFGKLQILRPLGSKGGTTHFLVKCDCGVERGLSGHHLTSGRQKSCGCMKPQTRRGQITYGGRGIYNIWRRMISRCYDTTDPGYRNYGLRGISVCDRWRNDCLAFVADMGSRPSSRHSIERRNNDGNYEPSNCYWLPLSQQGRNKRNNRRITWKGKTQPLVIWAEDLGLKWSTLNERLKRLPLEDAMVRGVMIQRRNLTWRGKTMDIRSWADEIGVSTKTLYRRVITCKMPLEKALQGPLRKRKK